MAVSTAMPPRQAWYRVLLKWPTFGYGLLTLMVIVLLAFTILQPIQVLPHIALSPGFSLIDQAGQRFTNEDLRGHLALYTFTYTNCQDPCPQTSQMFQMLQHRLAEVNTRGLPVDFVTISFDPVRDTPQRLADFARQLDADLQNWHFVTGESTVLKNVIGSSFGFYYNRNTNGDFSFEPAFVLVDGMGIVRAKYRTADLDPATVRRDLELIATEAQNNQGAARFAYEAAHLFLCYPK